jgi:hypothetical protein
VLLIEGKSHQRRYAVTAHTTWEDAASANSAERPSDGAEVDQNP